MLVDKKTVDQNDMAWLDEITLSDGSFAYNIVFKTQANFEIICDDKEQADRFFKNLNEMCVNLK